MQRLVYGDWILLATIVGTVLLDQISKHLIRTWIEFGQAIPLVGFIQLLHVTNSGSAFGFFQGQTLPLIVASVVGISLLLWFYIRQSRNQPTLGFCFGLLLGGAIGNLVDRVLLGRVTDFIDIGWWPTFNLADSAIVIGVAILAMGILIPQGKIGLKTSDEVEFRENLQRHSQSIECSISCAEESGNS